MTTEIRPQPRQERFLSSPADIVIYGGAAGGGKSWALLYEPLRHINTPGFGAVIFRSSMTQIREEGGLWDASMKLYKQFPKTRPIKSPKPYWQFPSGAKVSFRQISRDDDVYDWQGTEICLIEFDELTHFDKFQFFYMLSRNRSTCGVRPYIRASCNPDADSWVAEFIQWWWDPDTGYAIPERDGVLRWFARLNEEIVWGDTPDEVVEAANSLGYEVEIQREDVKSCTFIASSVYDNAVLLDRDPGYLANLKALPAVERERLLHGNWKIKAARGLYFPRSTIPDILHDIPDDVVQWVRGWDLAATDTDEGGDPAYTASILIGKRRDKSYVIADATNHRLKAEKVRALVKQCAVADKARHKRVRIRMSIDPGQAGKEQAQSYVKMLAGFSVSTVRETGSKVSRSEPFAAQWQAGNVAIVEGPWNETLLAQYEAFPESKFVDLVDAGSNAFNELERMNTASSLPSDTRESPLAKESYWFR